MRGWLAAEDLRHIKQAGVRPYYIEENLTSLIASPFAPDVIILGEDYLYEDGSSIASEVLFNAGYERVVIPYFDGTADMISFYFKGMAVWENPLAVDPSPIWMSSEERLEYHQFWLSRMPHQIELSRPFTHFIYQKNDHSPIYHLYPTHLINPWRAVNAIKNQKVEKEWFSDVARGPRVNWNLFMEFQSDDNPLYYQLSNMKTLFEASVDSFPEEAHIFLGDFNTASRSVPDEKKVLKHLVPISSKGYRLLADDFNDLFKGERPTIPSMISDELDENKPAFRIDHAFANDRVRKLQSAILTMRGSDHYPIWMEVSY